MCTNSNVAFTAAYFRFDKKGNIVLKRPSTAPRLLVSQNLQGIMRQAQSARRPNDFRVQSSKMPVNEAIVLDDDADEDEHEPREKRRKQTVASKHVVEID